ncbi:MULTISPECIES: oxygen-independent coproporphyrinogen III oxidase [unclassified Janthinobacterium]|uniref:oxygen-independent coproporphyrinogen III oxidase n=1 Tax=unclassified Janthinobacterium TaxID=2610881 RepID=UPI0003462F5F|nr:MULTISPECIES: oxygen-independent coproporphyrinogen III oxidase [unclassified Janthinobacterium]MEC5160349.1 oxygen-independent coproporphyrinogen-3 oxidase [Janthinobacterium sp. CG_S6]
MNPPRTVVALVPSVEFDAALIRKLNQMGPRYTSYPTADRFSGDFAQADYVDAVARVRAGARAAPLSLYVHIPFCESLCYYCACNKIVTRERDKAVLYLDYLKREIAMQGGLLAGMNRVEQLHFGGGTPTYLSDGQMDDLMACLRRWFDFAPDAQGEYSVEVDPRTVTPARIRTLRAQGFNRISLGVQDFDADVQRAVNRIQPEAETVGIIDAARQAGFRSISVDLIYGLPKQSPATMVPTLHKVIAANPDRIAVYNYAHMPHLFKSQRLIVAADLPTPDAKLDMLRLCIEMLGAAGYVYIGMDHFAKPDDDLAVSQREGRLHRNFQGYSTHAEAGMVALGVSGISALGGCYSQNDKTLGGYYAALDQKRLPIARGITLDPDDLLRRDIIGRLMCDFALSYAEAGLPDAAGFADYFAAELRALAPLAADGLLDMDADGLRVSLKGRLLIRNICMVFDNYLGRAGGAGPAPQRYSKTI